MNSAVQCVQVRGNQLHCAGKKYRCSVGENGFIPEAEKREGDKKTPIGYYALRRCFYREDQLARPETRLPLQPITQSMGWCDDASHSRYNQLVALPFAASHEKMWREDDCYNLVVELGHNDAPPVAGLGSAIFMHVAREGYKPTEGCVALAQADLLEILAQFSTETFIDMAPDEAL